MKHIKITKNDFDSTIAIGECTQTAAKQCQPLSNEAKERFEKMLSNCCGEDAATTNHETKNIARKRSNTILLNEEAK